MRIPLIVAAVVGLTVTVACLSPIAVQAKTVKECQAEWQADKVGFQAKGITEKQYVADCRAGKAAAKPDTPPASTPAAQPDKPTTAQKTAKECQAEWRADKAGFQAKGITEKQYVADCRAGKTAAKPDTPPASTPPASTPRASDKPAPAATTGAGQFTTEAAAKASCSSDLVVWVNLDSKIYHYSGTKNYGTTKTGVYMCEKTAIAQGMRASKTEKRPSA